MTTIQDDMTTGEVTPNPVIQRRDRWIHELRQGVRFETMGKRTCSGYRLTSSASCRKV